MIYNVWNDDDDRVKIIETRAGRARQFFKTTDGGCQRLFLLRRRRADKRAYVKTGGEP
jgi:hypothetical protein